jgi:hypothetical protein
VVGNGFFTAAAVIAGAGGLGVVWLLAKVGQALIKIAEALAAAAVVFLALWLVIKAVRWAWCQTLTHWRTQPDSGGAVGVVAVVGLGIPNPHRRGGRSTTDRVAAG